MSVTVHLPFQRPEGKFLLTVDKIAPANKANPFNDSLNLRQINVIILTDISQ